MKKVHLTGVFALLVAGLLALQAGIWMRPISTGRLCPIGGPRIALPRLQLPGSIKNSRTRITSQVHTGASSKRFKAV